MSLPRGAAGLAPVDQWGKGWTLGLSMVWSLLGTTVQATPIAGSIVAPLGLAAGSSSQLIFVTRGTHNGESADQSVHNSFVSTQAALNPELPSTTWHSITTVSGEPYIRQTPRG